MKHSGWEILRQVVFVVLLIGILVSAWYFVFRPRDLEDARMRQQIEAKRKQLHKLNRATANIGSLKDEIAELEKAIGFFQSKLPNEKEIDKVLAELWRLAESNNLATKNIMAVAQKKGGTFIAADGSHAEQPIKMRFEGDFLGLYGFLIALENQPRIMRIREMSLKDCKGPPGTVTADLEMSIFFERQGGRRL